jgi:hypothetical protein
MGRRRRDGKKERSWRKLLHEQSRSGLSVRAFCEQRGLRQHAFYFWRREVQRRDAERSTLKSSQSGPARRSVLQPQAFAAITVSDAGVGSSAPAIEIVLGNGVCLRLRENVDAKMLADVLAVLEKPAC